MNLNITSEIDALFNKAFSHSRKTMQNLSNIDSAIAEINAVGVARILAEDDKDFLKNLRLKIKLYEEIHQKYGYGSWVYSENKIALKEESDSFYNSIDSLYKIVDNYSKQAVLLSSIFMAVSKLEVIIDNLKIKNENKSNRFYKQIKMLEIHSIAKGYDYKDAVQDLTAFLTCANTFYDEEIITLGDRIILNVFEKSTLVKLRKNAKGKISHRRDGLNRRRTKVQGKLTQPYKDSFKTHLVAIENGLLELEVEIFLNNSQEQQ